MLKQIKIGLIILFLSTLSYAQDGATLLTLMSDDASYDADAQAYFDAMSTPLSTAYQDRINTFVLMVKDSLSISNLSDKFDAIYLLANETSEAGLKNLVKRSSDAEIGATTVTFTADQGFAGDGIAGYINTNYNQNSDAVVATQNSNSFGIYSRTNSVLTAFDIGATNGATNCSDIYIRYTGDHSYGRINTGISDYYDYTGATDSRGFFAMSRTASNNFNYYVNGDSVINQVANSAAFYDGDFFVCSENAGGAFTFSTRQYSFVFFGAGLTSTEMAKLNNCIEWYMDDLGTGVE